MGRGVKRREGRCKGGRCEGGGVRCEGGGLMV